jgi:uncharacterized protein YbjQ (UPF0145 family)
LFNSDQGSRFSKPYFMKKILITTTESLHGWEIEAYLKPVFASVVIGTNLFADIGASFSDLFGGRSSGYEKRLQLIKDNAITILSSKATELGANCILSLKVDVDEISGKNMQMFMITAVGMAVIAKNAKSQTDAKHIKEIDKDNIKERANLIRLAKKFQNFETGITVDELKIIIESRSSDFIEMAIAKLKTLGSANVGDDDFNKLYKEYFAGIDPNDAIAVLYPTLILESEENLLNSIVAIIKDNDLVDYGSVNKLLQNTLQRKKIALNILMAYKPSYNYDDIEVLKEMIERVKDSFPKVTTLTMKKGFLSSAEKEVWICPCNATNSIETNLCSGCYNDQYGFSSDELKPNQVVEILTNRLLALESFL